MFKKLHPGLKSSMRQSSQSSQIASARQRAVPCLAIIETPRCSGNNRGGCGSCRELLVAAGNRGTAGPASHDNGCPKKRQPHCADLFLWRIAVQPVQNAQNRPWIATGDGTTGAIHKSVSKRHASQLQAGLVEPNCQVCSKLQGCMIPAAVTSAAAIQKAT